MARRCKKCGANKVRRKLRTYSISTENSESGSEHTARIYFTRVFNLTINGVNRQYTAGEQATLDYPTIYSIINLTPSSPAVEFVYSEDEVKFHEFYS